MAEYVEHGTSPWSEQRASNTKHTNLEVADNANAMKIAALEAMPAR